MSARRSRALRVAQSTVRVLLIASFLMAAFGKFTSAPEAVAMFDALGLGLWLMYVTGAMELTGALLLAMRRTRLLGVALLSCVLIGATASHLGPVPGNPLVPATMLVLLLLASGGEVRGLSLKRAGAVA